MRELIRLLAPGTYPDGQGVRQVSAGYLQRLLQRGRDMVRAGLQIPVCPAFGDDVPEEERAFWRTKHNLGFVDGFEVRQDGALYAQADVPDEGDARKIRAAAPVTVELAHDFHSGDGKAWSGESILTISLRKATRPVQLSRGVVRLSLGDRRTTTMPDTTTLAGAEKLKKLREALRRFKILIPADMPDPGQSPMAFVELLTVAALNAADDDQYEEQPKPEAMPVQMSMARDRAELQQLKQDRADLAENMRRQREGRRADRVVGEIDAMMGRSK